MLTTVLVIAALVVGAVAGFAVGRKYQPVDPAQYRRVPRRSETTRATDLSDDIRPPLADELLVSGHTRTDLPVIPEATCTGNVSFSANHVGDVFVVLWRPERLLPVADVDVEIIWGGHRGTATIPVGPNPVAVKFGKNKAGAKDAVVTVNTSVPTVRGAIEGPNIDGHPVRTLDWK